MSMGARRTVVLAILLLRGTSQAVADSPLPCHVPGGFLPQCSIACAGHCGEIRECVTDHGVRHFTDCGTCRPNDLSVGVNDDGLALASPGQAVTYTIEVTNRGPSPVAGAGVADALPLQSVSWTCRGEAGASCTTSGSGDISDTVSLPIGGRVTYLATGVVPPTATGLLSNTASVTPPAGVVDPDHWNDSADDVDVVGGAGVALGFYTIAACRLLDTCDFDHDVIPWGGPAIPAQQMRLLPLDYGFCSIPSDARAMAVSVTVTGATSSGSVRLFPAAQCVPNPATVHYAAGQTRSSNAIVSADAKGHIAVFAGQPAGTVDVIVDVTGYFR
jgi:uncharacterized repeat protein (TIGR01451 family)